MERSRGERPVSSGVGKPTPDASGSGSITIPHHRRQTAASSSRSVQQQDSAKDKPSKGRGPGPSKKVGSGSTPGASGSNEPHYLRHTNASSAHLVQQNPVKVQSAITRPSTPAADTLPITPKKAWVLQSDDVAVNRQGQSKTPTRPPSRGEESPSSSRGRESPSPISSPVVSSRRRSSSFSSTLSPSRVLKSPSPSKGGGLLSPSRPQPKTLLPEKLNEIKKRLETSILPKSIKGEAIKDEEAVAVKVGTKQQVTMMENFVEAFEKGFQGNRTTATNPDETDKQAYNQLREKLKNILEKINSYVEQQDKDAPIARSFAENQKEYLLRLGRESLLDFESIMAEFVSVNPIKIFPEVKGIGLETKNFVEEIEVFKSINELLRGRNVIIQGRLSEPNHGSIGIANKKVDNEELEVNNDILSSIEQKIENLEVQKGALEAFVLLSQSDIIKNIIDIESYKQKLTEYWYEFTEKSTLIKNNREWLIEKLKAKLSKGSGDEKNFINQKIESIELLSQGSPSYLSDGEQPLPSSYPYIRQLVIPPLDSSPLKQQNQASGSRDPYPSDQTSETQPGYSDDPKNNFNILYSLFHLLRKELSKYRPELTLINQIFNEIQDFTNYQINWDEINQDQEIESRSNRLFSLYEPILYEYNVKIDHTSPEGIAKGLLGSLTKRVYNLNNPSSPTASTSTSQIAEADDIVPQLPTPTSATPQTSEGLSPQLFVEKLQELIEENLRGFEKGLGLEGVEDEDLKKAEIQSLDQEEFPEINGKISDLELFLELKNENQQGQTELDILQKKYNQLKEKYDQFRVNQEINKILLWWISKRNWPLENKDILKVIGGEYAVTITIDDKTDSKDPNCVIVNQQLPNIIYLLFLEALNTGDEDRVKIVEAERNLELLQKIKDIYIEIIRKNHDPEFTKLYELVDKHLYDFLEGLVKSLEIDIKKKSQDVFDDLIKLLRIKFNFDKTKLLYEEDVDKYIKTKEELETSLKKSEGDQSKQLLLKKYYGKLVIALSKLTIDILYSRSQAYAPYDNSTSDLIGDFGKFVADKKIERKEEVSLLSQNIENELRNPDFLQEGSLNIRNYIKELNLFLEYLKKFINSYEVEYVKQEISDCIWGLEDFRKKHEFNLFIDVVYGIRKRDPESEDIFTRFLLDNEVPSTQVSDYLQTLNSCEEGELFEKIKQIYNAINPNQPLRIDTDVSGDKTDLGVISPPSRPGSRKPSPRSTYTSPRNVVSGSGDASGSSPLSPRTQKFEKDYKVLQDHLNESIRLEKEFTKSLGEILESDVFSEEEKNNLRDKQLKIAHRRYLDVSAIELFLQLRKDLMSNKGEEEEEEAHIKFGEDFKRIGEQSKNTVPEETDIQKLKEKIKNLQEKLKKTKSELPDRLQKSHRTLHREIFEESFVLQTEICTAIAELSSFVIVLNQDEKDNIIKDLNSTYVGNESDQVLVSFSVTELGDVTLGYDDSNYTTNPDTPTNSKNIVDLSDGLSAIYGLIPEDIYQSFKSNGDSSSDLGDGQQFASQLGSFYKTIQNSNKRINRAAVVAKLIVEGNLEGARKVFIRSFADKGDSVDISRQNNELDVSKISAIRSDDDSYSVWSEDASDEETEDAEKKKEDDDSFGSEVEEEDVPGKETEDTKTIKAIDQEGQAQAQKQAQEKHSDDVRLRSNSSPPRPPTDKSPSPSSSLSEHNNGMMASKDLLTNSASGSQEARSKTPSPTSALPVSGTDEALATDRLECIFKDDSCKTRIAEIKTEIDALLKSNWESGTIATAAIGHFHEGKSASSSDSSRSPTEPSEPLPLVSGSAPISLPTTSFAPVSSQAIEDNEKRLSALNEELDYFVAREVIKKGENYNNLETRFKSLPENSEQKKLIQNGLDLLIQFQELRWNFDNFYGDKDVGKKFSDAFDKELRKIVNEEEFKTENIEKLQEELDQLRYQIYINQANTTINKEKSTRLAQLRGLQESLDTTNPEIDNSSINKINNLSIYLKHVGSINFEFQSIKERLEEASKEIPLLRDNQEVIGRQIVSLHDKSIRLGDRKKEDIIKIEQNIQKTESSIKEKQDKLTQVSTRIQEIKSSNATLIRDRGEINREIEQLRELIVEKSEQALYNQKQLQENIDDDLRKQLVAECEKYEKEIKKYEKEIEYTELSSLAWETELKSLKEQDAKLKGEISTLSEQKVRQQEELEQQQIDIKALRQEISRLEEKRKSVQQQITNKDQQKQQLQQQFSISLRSEEIQLIQLRQALICCDEVVSQIDKDIREMKNKIEDESRAQEADEMKSPADEHGKELGITANSNLSVPGLSLSDELANAGQEEEEQASPHHSPRPSPGQKEPEEEQQEGEQQEGEEQEGEEQEEEEQEEEEQEEEEQEEEEQEEEEQEEEEQAGKPKVEGQDSSSSSTESSPRTPSPRHSPRPSPITIPETPSPPKDDTANLKPDSSAVFTTPAAQSSYTGADSSVTTIGTATDPFTTPPIARDGFPTTPDTSGTSRQLFPDREDSLINIMQEITKWMDQRIKFLYEQKIAVCTKGYDEKSKNTFDLGYEAQRLGDDHSKIVLEYLQLTNLLISTRNSHEAIGLKYESLIGIFRKLVEVNLTDKNIVYTESCEYIRRNLIDRLTVDEETSELLKIFNEIKDRLEQAQLERTQLVYESQSSDSILSLPNSLEVPYEGFSRFDSLNSEITQDIISSSLSGNKISEDTTNKAQKLLRYSKIKSEHLPIFEEIEEVFELVEKYIDPKNQEDQEDQEDQENQEKTRMIILGKLNIIKNHLEGKPELKNLKNIPKELFEAISTKELQTSYGFFSKKGSEIIKERLEKDLKNYKKFLNRKYLLPELEYSYLIKDIDIIAAVLNKAITDKAEDLTKAQSFINLIRVVAMQQESLMRKYGGDQVYQDLEESIRQIMRRPHSDGASYINFLSKCNFSYQHGIQTPDMTQEDSAEMPFSPINIGSPTSIAMDEMDEEDEDEDKDKDKDKDKDEDEDVDVDVDVDKDYLKAKFINKIAEAYVGEATLCIDPKTLIERMIEYEVVDFAKLNIDQICSFTNDDIYKMVDACYEALLTRTMSPGQAPSGVQANAVSSRAARSSGSDEHLTT